ncbi:MAG: GGDEF domain-containing protein [Woeseiaceae bacterium]|nr:GGDEF domain-containing protein [Woeseiaceae bacterium]MDX2606773.1 GGDEF domain-containing protein [Woeseiaceae bacterium]
MPMNEPLKSTRILELPGKQHSLWATLWTRSLKLLSNVWTTTDFDKAAVTVFAERVMQAELRKGIIVMALVSFLIQIAAIALYQKLGLHGSYLYTFALLALLSVHVIWSTRFVSDLSALNLLGMLLLIFTGVAIMAIAHRSGSFNAGLMSSIVLLFMVMPIAPWGLREACIVVALTYVTFTFSLLGVDNRFETETLWTVQFLIIASAATAMLTIVRNTIVRRHDIRTRFKLEDAYSELQLVSTRDPLTGLWNRRYIEQTFDDFAQRCYDTRECVRFALLDIDHFKHFNDTYGHHHGDVILQRLAKEFTETLPGDAHIIRLGGDEFAIVYSGDGFNKIISRCLDHLATDPKLLDVSDGTPVTVSVGFAAEKADQLADLETLYKEADKALYQAKDRRVGTPPGGDLQAQELAAAVPVAAKL